MPLNEKQNRLNEALRAILEEYFHAADPANNIPLSEADREVVEEVLRDYEEHRENTRFSIATTLETVDILLGLLKRGQPENYNPETELLSSKTIEDLKIYRENLKYASGMKP